MKKLPIRLATLAQDKPQSGQALLIILLIMAVALTIGLSVASRSITDIRISQESEESARAFSAAEAGIESALIGSSLTGTFTETGASYQATTVGVGEGATEFVFPQVLNINEPQTLYLAKYETDGSLTRYYTAGVMDVCWEGEAALEVEIFWKSGNNYKVARGAYDPNSSRRATNGFTVPDSGFPCLGLSAEKTLKFNSDFGIPSSATLLFLRLRVLYNQAKVGVKPAGGNGGTLPSQGTQIESIGQAGGVVRKIQLVRFNPAPPNIFDFVLYSEGDLIK